MRSKYGLPAALVLAGLLAPGLWLAADSLTISTPRDLPGLSGRLDRQGLALGKLSADTTVPTITLSAAGAASGISSSYTYTLGASVNGGNFTITVAGQTTANISGTASTATIKAALEALSNVGTGGVVAVSNPSGHTYNFVLADAATQAAYGQSFTVTNVNLTGGGVNSFAPNPAAVLPVVSTATDAAANTTDFQWYGSAPVQAGAAVGAGADRVKDFKLNSANSTASLDAEIVVTSTQFELPIKGQSAAYRVLVDGKEVLYAGPPVHSGTAQAGASNTITLAAGASGTTGAYAVYDVAITGGTGAGQQKRIVAYNGTTKVARISGTWTTPPDATSTYELRFPGAPFVGPAADGSLYNLLFNFGGVRASRRVEVQTIGDFGGVRVGQADSYGRPERRRGLRCLWVDDSFGEGTGALSAQRSYAEIACEQMGWECWNLSSGATGYLNAGTTGRFNTLDRIAPPSCSWWFTLGGPSGGTYTLSFGGQTTAAIANGATVAQIQSALEALGSVGVGNVTVGGPTNAKYVVLFRNGLAASGNTLTIDGTGLTGTNAHALVGRYLGDVKPYLPVDGAGRVLPCVVLFATGLNDNGLDQAAATANAAACWRTAQAFGPNVQVVVLGPHTGTGTPASTVVSLDALLAAQAATTLRKIDGRTPYVSICLSTTKNLLRRGTGNLSAPAGDGDADALTWTDGTHPSPAGHEADGRRLPGRVLPLLASP